MCGDGIAVSKYLPVLSSFLKSCLTLKLNIKDLICYKVDNFRLLRSKHNIFRSTVQVEAHQASVMAECEKCQPLLP